MIINNDCNIYIQLFVFEILITFSHLFFQYVYMFLRSDLKRFSFK